MDKKRNSESGLVIVEATIVFPVMFLVIFLMIFTANAYMQKCRVDALVTKLALHGAAYCADPMLDEVEAGKIPDIKSLDVQPYRHLFGGMEDIEKKIKADVKKQFEGMSTGLFNHMKPEATDVSMPLVEYQNGFLYSTFFIEIQYKIVMPVRLLGDTGNIAFYMSTRADMPVSDPTEFIRNIDMVEDYSERFFGNNPAGMIDKMFEHVKEWFNKSK